MKPNNNIISGGDFSTNQPDSQQLAANVIRQQIDSLYTSGDAQPAPQTQPEQPLSTQSSADVYNRTHTSNPRPEADQWKAYHSAWQNYYQQYYSRYYAQQATQDAQATQDTQATSSNIFEASSTRRNNLAEEYISRNTALNELRQQLRIKVQTSAKKVRGSRHFIPILASLSIVAVFLFLQYNSIIFATVNAYISPGSINAQNIIVDTSSSVVVSDEPLLIIPKINVEVPVLYDVGVDYDSQMAAMEKGVAHFPIPGANSHPGEVGNTVLSGHSSNDLFDTGDYKFIFARLDKLEIGDTIYANYEGTRYTYIVTKTEVVKPTEVSKLVYETDVPVLTLITCTPLGTDLNRLLVTAEQVSPDPADAKAAPTSDDDQTTTEIPGSSPTILEKLFS